MSRIEQGLATSCAAADRSEVNSGIGTMEPRLGVSVIVPTFNEGKNIAQLIGQCLNALPPAKYDAEILVVDDDSDDYTWQYPKRLFGHDSRVRVIRRQTSDTGLAQSVVDGLRNARHENCAVIDADLQHPPSKLPQLFDALDDGANIAIGSRHVDGGAIENWPWWRKVVSKGATVAAKVAVPDIRGVTDPMSGFFAIRRSLVNCVTLEPQGYKILLELIGKINADTIVEVPYVFRERERGESKLTASEYRNFLEHLGQLAVSSRYDADLIDLARVVRGAKFAIVGAAGTMVNMVVFAVLTFGVAVHFIAAGVGAFLVALNWNFLGNWLFTYDRPRGSVSKQYIRFHLVSLTGFVIYSLTLTGLVGAGVNKLAANATAILVGAGVNFLGSDELVFPIDDNERSRITAPGSTGGSDE